MLASQGRAGSDRAIGAPGTLRIASKDADGIELLEARQHTFNPVDTAVQELRHPVKAGAKVTILVEQLEKMQRDDAVAMVANVNPYLLK